MKSSGLINYKKSCLVTMEFSFKNICFKIKVKELKKQKDIETGRQMDGWIDREIDGGS